MKTNYETWICVDINKKIEKNKSWMSQINTRLNINEAGLLIISVIGDTNGVIDYVNA